MHKPVYAIITGQLRDRLDFNVTLTRLMNWRAQGLIDHIILSTWKEELHLNVRKELEKNGVITIASDPMEIPPLNGYFMHQHATLFNGLSLCPDDCLVFRIRADKDSVFMAQFVPALEKHEVPESVHYGAFPRVFTGRLHTIPAWLSMPFLTHGSILYGTRRDLQQLCHFNVKLHALCDNDSFATEVAWNSIPFFESFPEILVFFRDFNAYSVSRALVKAARMSGRDFVLPDFFNELFAIYYTALHSQFSLLPLRTVNDDFNICFEELFSGAAGNERAIAYDDSASVGSGVTDCHIEKIVAGNLIPSAGYEKFLKTIERLREQGGSFGRCLDSTRFRLNKESEKEVSDFLDKADLPYAYIPRVAINPGKTDWPENPGFLQSEELWEDSRPLSHQSERIQALWMDALKTGRGIHGVLVKIAEGLCRSSDPADGELAQRYFAEAEAREISNYCNIKLEQRKK